MQLSFYQNEERMRPVGDFLWMVCNCFKFLLVGWHERHSTCKTGVLNWSNFSRGGTAGFQ